MGFPHSAAQIFVKCYILKWRCTVFSVGITLFKNKNLRHDKNIIQELRLSTRNRQDWKTYHLGSLELYYWYCNPTAYARHQFVGHSTLARTTQCWITFSGVSSVDALFQSTASFRLREGKKASSFLPILAIQHSQITEFLVKPSFRRKRD